MIRKDDILKMTEKGISVFRYYLPVDFKVGKNFLNPFYKDTKASCNIYYERKAGVFKMKDFGNEDYSGDCFELVGRLNGLNCKEPKEFVEIMEIINRDLHLGLSAHEEYHVSILYASFATPFQTCIARFQVMLYANNIARRTIIAIT